jgi:hypothetical protein
MEKMKRQMVHVTELEIALAEIERLRTELKIRVEWFEKAGQPGMAEATRAALTYADAGLRPGQDF